MPAKNKIKKGVKKTVQKKAIKKTAPVTTAAAVAIAPSIISAATTIIINRAGINGKAPVDKKTYAAKKSSGQVTKKEQPVLAEPAAMKAGLVTKLTTEGLKLRQAKKSLKRKKGGVQIGVLTEKKLKAMKFIMEAPPTYAK